MKTNYLKLTYNTQIKQHKIRKTIFLRILHFLSLLKYLVNYISMTVSEIYDNFSFSLLSIVIFLTPPTGSCHNRYPNEYL